MNHKKKFLGNAHWLVDVFVVLGVVVSLSGVFLHATPVPPVLSRIFVDAGAGIAVAGIAAHLLS